MHFGFQNAPATFQRVMNRILRPYQQYASAHVNNVVMHITNSVTHLPVSKLYWLFSVKQFSLPIPKSVPLVLEEAKYLSYTTGHGIKQNKSHPMTMPHKQKTGQSFTWYNWSLFQREKLYCSMAKWSPETEKSFQVLLCQVPCAQPPVFGYKVGIGFGDQPHSSKTNGP